MAVAPAEGEGVAVARAVGGAGDFGLPLRVGFGVALAARFGADVFVAADVRKLAHRGEDVGVVDLLHEVVVDLLDVVVGREVPGGDFDSGVAELVLVFGPEAGDADPLALPAGLHYLANGVAVELDGIRVAGLGGTFAPTLFDTPAADLPHPRKGTAKATILADRRRHFVRQEVEACKTLREIDVFLTHEAPRPYFAGTGPRRNDAGKTAINEVLTALKPRLHLFGHHHRFTEQERQGVRSIGLDLVSRSYLLIDAGTLEYEQKIQAP